MAFSAPSTDIKRPGNFLTAKLKKDEEWVDLSDDLNKYIGANSKDENLDVNGSNWCATADHSKTRLEVHTILHFSLPSASEGMTEGCMDLDSYLANDNGKLTFSDKPHKSILFSCSCFMLEGTTLQALCMGSDEKMHYSEIDLIERFNLVNGNWSLQRDLRNQTQIILFFIPLLLPFIAPKVTKAVTEFVDDAMSEDGFITRFLERVPALGFGAACVHALRGDTARAGRAIAYCANSTIVCAGMFVGFCVGGGPLGAAIGAGIATPIGVLLETSLTDTLRGKPGLKDKFEEATIGRYIYETARNMIAAGSAGYVAEKFAGSALNSAVEKCVGEVLTKYGVVVSEAAMYALLKKAFDALEGKVSDLAEWEKTVEEVEKLKKEKAEAHNNKV